MRPLSVLVASAEEAPLIEAMMQPYLMELSGKAIHYPRLELYWQEPSRYPYLLRERSRLAGFALVRRLENESSFELSEFYVEAAFRRRGLASEAAHTLFRTHIGIWSVSVRADNLAGQRFWAALFAAIPAATSTAALSPAGLVYTFSSANA